MAALVKDAVTRELLLDSRLRLYSPEHLISETLRLLKTNVSLRKRIGLPAKELEELFYLLTQQVETVSKREITPFMADSIKLAPHKEDAPYLATALAMNIPVWSNDAGFQAQSKVKIYTTKEIVKILAKHRI